MNASHTGSLPTALPARPTQKWNVNLVGRVSYPLIVGDRVYVTVQKRTASNDLPGVGPAGAKLVALDASTGTVVWGPIDLGGTGHFAGHAYESGRVFAVNRDGVLRAFDADAGKLLWARELGDAVTAPPTAFEGMLYVATTAGHMVAVEQRTGDIRWVSRITRGEDSSPAISDDGVFVSYACGSVDALSPTNGASKWHVGPWDCAGQGGTTPVIAGDRLLVRVASGNVYDPETTGDDMVLAIATGALIREFDTAVPPAITGSQAYLMPMTDPEIGFVAEDVASGHRSWVATNNGLSGTASNPVVVGDTMFHAIGTGYMVGIDRSTGRETWRDLPDVPPLDDLPDDVIFGHHSAIAAGNGLLVVPAAGRLVAYA